MEVLNIKGTDDYPGILLDKSLGKFQISGRSLPEDSAGFYQPVLDWIESYAKEPNSSTDFIFKLEYFNTASSKFIQDILTLLDRIPGVKIIWYFLEDDESMEETGHEFSELVNVPFEFKII